MTADALAEKQPQDLVATKELLLKELEIFEEAIWRNEETGEKRFNFFLSLGTAIAGAVVVLWSSKDLSPTISDLRPQITFGASLALLLFGMVTFMRLAHRDRVTAQYKRTTHHVRRHYQEIFLKSVPHMNNFNVPCKLKLSAADDDGKSAFARGIKKFFKGGYAVSMAFINAGLLTTTIIAYHLHPDIDASVINVSFRWGLALLVVLGILASIPYPNKESDPTRARKQ